MRQVLIVALCLSALGCAYHDNPAAPSPLPDLTAPARVNLDATPGTGPTAGTAIVTATVTNVNGLGLGSVAVVFAVDAGTIPASATTNVAGAAIVTLTAQPGAAKVSARVGTIIATTLVAIQPPPPALPPTCQTNCQPPSPPPPVPPPLPFAITLLATQAAAGSATTFGMQSTAGVTRADWTFGDPSSTTNNSATTAGPNTSHVYAHSGVYQASVIAHDALGRTASSVATVVIPDAPVPPPTPPASLSASMTCTPGAHGAVSSCNVQARYGTATLPSAVITSVAWDWGDGQTDTTTAPVDTHTYVNAGTYPIFATVTATTVDGPKTATASQSLIVP